LYLLTLIKWELYFRSNTWC